MTKLQQQLNDELDKFNVMVERESCRLHAIALELKQAILDGKESYNPSIFPPEVADKVDHAALRITCFIWDCLQVKGVRQASKKHSKIRKALGFLKPNER